VCVCVGRWVVGVLVCVREGVYVCMCVCVCVTLGQQCRDSILLLSQIWESLSPSLSPPRPPPPAPPSPLAATICPRAYRACHLSFLSPLLGLGFRDEFSMCGLGIRADRACHLLSSVSSLIERVTCHFLLLSLSPILVQGLGVKV
jgi:hypothetical protein